MQFIVQRNRHIPNLAGVWMLIAKFDMTPGLAYLLVPPLLEGLNQVPTGICPAGHNYTYRRTHSLKILPFSELSQMSREKLEPGRVRGFGFRRLGVLAKM